MRVKPLSSYVPGKDFPPGMSIHKPGNYVREWGLIPVKLRIGYKHDSKTGKNNPDNPVECFRICDYVEEYENDNKLLWEIFYKIKNGEGFLYNGRKVIWNEETHFYSFFKREKQPSMLEVLAEITLMNIGIEYESQVSFEWCRIGYKNFAYDFSLPKYKLLIEVDGKQHRAPIGFFGGKKALDNQKTRDTEKDRLAIEHDYCVLHIPDYQIYEFEEILTKKLKEIIIDDIGENKIV